MCRVQDLFCLSLLGLTQPWIIFSYCTPWQYYRIYGLDLPTSSTTGMREAADGRQSAAANPPCSSWHCSTPGAGATGEYQQLLGAGKKWRALLCGDVMRNDVWWSCEMLFAGA